MMKTKLRLALLTLVAITATSCSIFQNQEKRAQNHLRKATQLDPSILKSTEKDSVRIVDSIRLVDSIRIKDSIDIRIKDSTIIIPKSDLSGDIEDPCDSIKGLKPFDYKLGSGVHKLRVWSDGKRIRYSSSVDSLVSVIRSRDSYTLQLKDELRIKDSIHAEEVAKLKKDVITVIKYQPTTWQTIKLLFFGLLIGAVVGYLVAKFTKFRIPFLG